MKNYSLSLQPIILIVVVCFSTLILWSPRSSVGASEMQKSSVANQPIEQDEFDKDMSEITELVHFFCSNIYPRPTLGVCIERIKHGIGKIADSHTKYLSPKESKAYWHEGSLGGFVGLGFQFERTTETDAQYVVTNIYDDTPASRAGLLVGDIITSIFADERISIPTFSIETSDKLLTLLRGEAGTTAVFSIRRNRVDQEIYFRIVRETITIPQIEGKLVSSGGKTYAFIVNKQFDENNAFDFAKVLKALRKKAKGKLDGIIIDMENNPGGSFHEAYNLTRLFDVYSKDIILERGNNGIERYVPNSDQMLSRQTRNIALGSPVLIVVSDECASACEIFARALKHRGLAVIAGTSNTYGKGVVQSFEDLSTGASLKYTSSEYLIGDMTDWVPVQCIGVGLDIQFTYPGITHRKSDKECDIPGHVISAGPMQNAPPHLPISEANPILYQEGLKMLDVYKKLKLPELQKREIIRQKKEAE